MRKWNMTMRFWKDVEFKVEANTYDEAMAQACKLAQDFPDDALVEDINYTLLDSEELPNNYEFADGYYDDPDDEEEEEEEEFEPGRTYVDVMGLNP